MYQLINWRRNSQPSTICWKDVFYFVLIDFGNQGVQVVAYRSATIHAGEICAVVQLQFPPKLERSRASRAFEPLTTASQANFPSKIWNLTIDKKKWVKKNLTIDFSF